MSLVRINKSVDFGQPGSRWGSNCSLVQRKIPLPSLFFLCELHGWAGAVNQKAKTSFECRKGENWPVNSLMCFYIRSKGIEVCYAGSGEAKSAPILSNVSEGQNVHSGENETKVTFV